MNRTTPAWVKDAVFYQIFPDRFAKSSRIAKATNLEPWESTPTPHGYKGGDLLGVAEHLDHLEALGVNALYFCPVFQSGSNHRYHTHDYYKVDPMLGGNEALRELCQEAHARGMRIVLDGVFNHASRGFFQFHDILENGAQSAYLDWFHIESFPVRAYHTAEPPNYQAWWGYPALPKFNTQSPAVREFLWDVGEYWIREGIDGWRLDVPNEIDDDAFWQEFRRRVKRANPDAYIVGEIWTDARRWLSGDQFDGVMNYIFTRLCLSFFGAHTLQNELISKCGIGHIEPIDVYSFAHSIEALIEFYGWEVALCQLNLLGSHDTPRLLSMLGDDTSAVRLAVTFQMCYPGAPCIFYGDEIGLSGKQDPDCRKAMPWDRSSWNEEILEATRQAIKARQKIPALRDGRYRTLAAANGVLAFERRSDDNSSLAIVVINTAYETRELTLSVDDQKYQDVFTDSRFTPEGGQLVLYLRERSALVLERM